MYFFALATDYDGTLATDGRIDAATVAALERLRRSGRKALLVTGRELDDLQRACDRLYLFDLVVAENGALLHSPSEHTDIPLAPPPPQAFIDRLRAWQVEPLAVGRGIVATWQPQEAKVLRAIRELGLDWQITFNKGAVMVLPAGVNKASGLMAALDRLGLSPHNVVAVGDAENDHAFLIRCGCAVAVANALPALKAEADLVTAGARGEGVTELIDRLIADDLASVPLRATVLLGSDDQGREVGLPPRSGSVLVAGTSGGGKSTLALGLVERLLGAGYQVCVFDPEGDYESLGALVPVGSADHAPDPSRVAINLLGVGLGDRPRLFAATMSQLREMRSLTGRPHWIVADEAHHLVPAEWQPAGDALPAWMGAILLLTVHPDHLSAEALAGVETLVAVGGTPADTLHRFATTIGAPAPDIPPDALPDGQAWVWRRDEDSASRITITPPTIERRRHHRKYVTGALGEDKSFYFRGPAGKLNLRAQNLILFVQLAGGVDDETWLYHLKRGDYSNWFREVIKDDDLAREVEAVERGDEDARESRRGVIEAIERRYGGAI